MVSNAGGADARWNRDGREIVYISSDMRMMAVPVQTAPAVRLGTPVTLFAAASKRWVSYDMSPDGKRFLVIIPEVIANEQPLTAFLNVGPKGGGKGKGRVEFGRAGALTVSVSRWSLHGAETAGAQLPPLREIGSPDSAAAVQLRMTVSAGRVG